MTKRERKRSTGGNQDSRRASFSLGERQELPYTSVVITLRVMKLHHAERDDYTIFCRSPYGPAGITGPAGPGLGVVGGLGGGKLQCTRAIQDFLFELALATFWNPG